MATHRHPITVRFAETDAMGIVHHSSYLLYLEEARVAYLAAHGHDYDVIHEAGEDFSVIEVHLAYRKPVRFGERVMVDTTISQIKGARFTIDYTVSVGDDVRVTAQTVHATVDRNGRPRRPPAWLHDFID
jgi:acyl-CoA thioester hydrolase